MEFKQQIQPAIRRMNNAIERLLEISSESLSPAPTLIGLEPLPKSDRARELLDLLKNRNGFYAFESALHVFPMNTSKRSLGVFDWNKDDLWRGEYGDIEQDVLFFAQDVFGYQFYITQDQVRRFDPETGESEAISSSLSVWVRKLLADYDFLTGFTFAHNWQNANGPIPDFKRLCPKIPFVLGGAYELNNFFLTDAVSGMHSRANIARQIKDLPDGTKVRMETVD